MHTRGVRIPPRVLACLIAFSFCVPPPVGVLAQEGADVPRPRYVSAATVQRWLDQGEAVTWLDVRKADEFAAGHIAHAINVVFDQVASLADQLPHDHPIVLYCIHSTHRAPTAARTLNTLGFTNAYVLEGGIVAWSAEGLPIQATDVAQAPKILPQLACLCSGVATPCDARCSPPWPSWP